MSDQDELWIELADAMLKTWHAPSVEDINQVRREAHAALPVVRRHQARALREFADAHRFPSDWVMFRREGSETVSVPDLLRETADRLEAGT